MYVDDASYSGGRVYENMHEAIQPYMGVSADNILVALNGITYHALTGIHNDVPNVHAT